MLNDSRDASFIRLVLISTLWAFGGAITLFAWEGFPLWFAVIYLVGLLAWLMPPFMLMLHFTSHRPLFTKRWNALNAYVPLCLGVFFGQTPGTYAAHHVGMHHPEQNSWADASSTMSFQRDSAWAFARYLGRFYLIGIVDLARYLFNVKRERLLHRAMTGEALYFLGIVTLLVLNPMATLVVFVVPFLLARFVMMAGNWGQHAFIDAALPLSPLHNSTTCTAHPYNDRCFNDGFHTAHHLRPGLHWSELPAEFERERARYQAEGAIVFKNVDFLGVWALLLTHQYQRLATRFVQLGREKLTEAQVIAMLRSRVAPILRPIVVEVEVEVGVGVA